MELSGKNAIVTGSTGSLGSELTMALARAGCDCVCHYHKEREKAEKLVDDIKAMSRKAVAVEADLTEPVQVEAMFEQLNRTAPPQVLINSAAVFKRTPLREVNFEKARQFFDLNITACIFTAKLFAKNLKSKKQPAGKIINLCDVAATRPWAGYSLYCASKAGLIGVTKALAKELAPDILVNAISPGIADWPGGDEEDKKRQLDFIPMRRFADASEIAAAMIFLLRNDYVTGQALNVCGGRAI